MFRPTPLLIGLLVVAATSGPVTANPPGTPPAGGERRTCAEASITDIRLPQLMAVDEVRVEVADTSPATGAAQVRIDAGRFGRVVRVWGQGSRGLKFTPALTAAHFEVALDPVFEAQRTACVERVVLLRDGRPVAAVTP